MLASKTILINAEFPNADSLCHLTLFYTADEVSGWETTTGNSAEQLQIIYSAGSISAITPATPFANGIIDFGINEANDSFGNLGSIQLSATVLGTFGGFGIGNPELLTGITEESAQQTLVISPNPNTGRFTLRLPSSEGEPMLEARLFNSLGEIVFRQSFAGQEAVLQAPALPTGIYCLLVQNERGDKIGVGRVMLANR